MLLKSILLESVASVALLFGSTAAFATYPVSGVLAPDKVASVSIFIEIAKTADMSKVTMAPASILDQLALAPDPVLGQLVLAPDPVLDQLVFAPDPSVYHLAISGASNGLVPKPPHDFVVGKGDTTDVLSGSASGLRPPIGLLAWNPNIRTDKLRFGK